jgi:hypothetical protein
MIACMRASYTSILQEYSAVYVASQRLEQLLELMANDGDTRPLVVTSKDRLDIVMGLLASQVRAGGTTWWYQYCRLRPLHATQPQHTCAVRWCQAGVC